MKSLTLKHIRYFQALAAQRHFGRAAEVCSISQPALSLQIKELEGIMGGPMVERATREVRLTALGEDFLARGSEILRQVDDVSTLVRRQAGPFSGRLRLGVIPTVAPYLLPRVIQALAQRYPDLKLEPKETITQSLVQEILASRLDAAIVALPVTEPSLQEFALFDEEFLLVRPAQDVDLPVPTTAVLPTMELLLLEEGHCFRDQALSFCDSTAVRPRQIMEGSSLSTLVQMVSAGIGVTLIPEMARSFETRSADVAVARFPVPAPNRTIGMIWRKTNPLTPELMEMGAIIRKVAEAE